MSNAFRVASSVGGGPFARSDPTEQPLRSALDALVRNEVQELGPDGLKNLSPPTKLALWARALNIAERALTQLAEFAPAAVDETPTAPAGFQLSEFRAAGYQLPEFRERLAAMGGLPPAVAVLVAEEPLPVLPPSSAEGWESHSPPPRGGAGERSFFGHSRTGV